jgi:hypothetical protein
LKARSSSSSSSTCSGRVLLQHHCGMLQKLWLGCCHHLGSRQAHRRVALLTLLHHMHMHLLQLQADLLLLQAQLLLL